MKWRKALFPLILTGLIIALSWPWLPTAGPEDSPDITLKTINGSAVALKELRGRPVLVTFWSTTCPTCLNEMPHLAELYRELSPRGLEIIGIAMYHDPPNRVLNLYRKRGIPYTIALDIDAEAARAFGNVRVTPTSFLIDPDGMIVYRNSGVMHMESVRLKIMDMLAGGNRSAPATGTGDTG